MSVYNMSILHPTYASSSVDLLDNNNPVLNLLFDKVSGGYRNFGWNVNNVILRIEWLIQGTFT